MRRLWIRDLAAGRPGAGTGPSSEHGRPQWLQERRHARDAGPLRESSIRIRHARANASDGGSTNDAHVLSKPVRSCTLHDASAHGRKHDAELQFSAAFYFAKCFCRVVPYLLKGTGLQVASRWQDARSPAAPVSPVAARLLQRNPVLLRTAQCCFRCTAGLGSESLLNAKRSRKPCVQVALSSPLCLSKRAPSTPPPPTSDRIKVGWQEPDVTTVTILCCQEGSGKEKGADCSLCAVDPQLRNVAPLSARNQSGSDVASCNSIRFRCMVRIPNPIRL